MEDMIPACPLRQELVPQPEHGGEEMEPEAAEDEAGSTSELCLSNRLYINSELRQKGIVSFVYWFD
jgi:hypothetical protein